MAELKRDSIVGTCCALSSTLEEEFDSDRDERIQKNKAEIEGGLGSMYRLQRKQNKETRKGTSHAGTRFQGPTGRRRPPVRQGPTRLAADQHRITSHSPVTHLEHAEDSVHFVP